MSDADREPPTHDALRRELLALAAEDLRLRAELEAEGTLHDGYHPRMEAVHRRNAAVLRAALDAHGWPGRAMVGDDGTEAAWLIAQHAIGEPALQRRCVALLWAAAERGEVPAWQPAYLEDRVRRFEGRPQRWATQIETDDDGNPVVPPDLEEPAAVDARRAAVGLEPLAERLARMGRLPMPRDRERFEREYAEWLQRVGWR